ncbi:hypothetical protein [Clostridium botulinum]|uniref:hypothetical protein n=1 Tax=Clostridium botulinum TaxID=1491 RepID=UPI002491788E|nr:hypothetical protein [Clostridium botulinum]BDB03637.1 hypothetical protein CBOS2020_37110 [Clostridium botulinum]
MAKKLEASYYFDNIKRQLKYFDGITMIQLDKYRDVYEEKGKIIMKISNDIETLQDSFENFLKLHSKEIERIRKLDKKQISSIGL